MITNATKKPRALLVKGKWWQRLFGLCPSNPQGRSHCKHHERKEYKAVTRHGDGSTETTRATYCEKCCWCNHVWWDDPSLRDQIVEEDGY